MRSTPNITVEIETIAMDDLLHPDADPGGRRHRPRLLRAEH